MILKNQELKDYKGEVIKNGKENVDLKVVITNCLNFENEKLKMTAEQKTRAYLLSVAFIANNEVELKSEDIVFIKARLLQIYSPLIFGQVVEILEPSVKKVDK